MSYEKSSDRIISVIEIATSYKPLLKSDADGQYIVDDNTGDILFRESDESTLWDAFCRWWNLVLLRSYLTGCK